MILEDDGADGPKMASEHNTSLLQPGMEHCHGYQFVNISSTKLAYFGGDGPGHCSNLSLVYDTEKQEWSPMGPLPYGRTFRTDNKL